MKIVSSLIASLVLASTAFAATIPENRTFVGGGEWRDNQGHKGSYGVTTTIVNGSINSVYKFDGQIRTFDMTLAQISEGFYSVVAGGETGSLYCFDVQCHATVGKEEETLTFYQDKLYKLGSKKAADGQVIVWQESLTAKN